MVLHLPTLLVASTLLVLLAACAMTLFGLTQRVYRGYGAWTLAAWLASAGVALLWFGGHPLAMLAGHVLLLQWPASIASGWPPNHSSATPALASQAASVQAP